MAESGKNKKKDQRGTWAQALSSLFFSVLLVLSLRWLLIEPYVIPSGSMYPTLLVNDHIFVNKLAYGLRWPFSMKWVFRTTAPEIGDVVVFKAVDQPDTFMIKRVIGRPGDHVVIDSAGEVSVNGESFSFKKMNWRGSAIEKEPFAREDFEDFEDYQVGLEKMPNRSHFVLRLPETARSKTEFQVPEERLFVMGDNRERSSDSRVWGFLPMDHLLGRASLIWFSCGRGQVKAFVDCRPDELRLRRFFKFID